MNYWMNISIMDPCRIYFVSSKPWKMYYLSILNSKQRDFQDNVLNVIETNINLDFYNLFYLFHD